MKLFNKKKKISHFSFQKGFTLIELLIVIAILGILAVAILVAINPGQRIAAARNSRVRSDLANLGSAANIFNTDTGLSTDCVGGGSYPSSFNQTVCNAKFPASPISPSGSAYTYKKIPGAQAQPAIAACAPNTAIPCTAISIEGPAYSDGFISTTTSNMWCWRSATGTITQSTAAICAP